jgi:hypothetical protein
MAYELFVRTSDLTSEKIMLVLLDRKLPFAEVQLNESDAEALEAVSGNKLPFGMANKRVIGGYSDLVNHLRKPSQSATRPLLAW